MPMNLYELTILISVHKYYTGMNEKNNSNLILAVLG